MKHGNSFSRIFAILAIVLLCAMCSTVAYEYAALLWAGKCGFTSAPAWVAFLLAIPFAIGIVISLALHLFFKKKA
ncbi:MAG: hypothetical protein IJW38_01090 [Clostridia bacterium]|nr:hypothetical protein [Clostridia bacterium]